MAIAFICPKCASVINEWRPIRCGKCHHEIRDNNGIYIFTNDKNHDIETKGSKYIGFDVIAPNYDETRDRLVDSKEGRFIAEWLGPNKTVLEIGAGTGYHSISLAKAGCKVVAADISMNMLRIMASKSNKMYKELLMPSKMNAYFLPIVDKSLDAILVDHVFHLIEEPEKVIHEIKRVMKPEGFFFNIFYSSELLPGQESNDNLYTEICQKIDEYYNTVIKERGLKLLERFGWISQAAQQENLKRLFKYYDVIQSNELRKKWTFPVWDHLMNYRKRVLVSQAELDETINNEIIEEISERLITEYGEDYGKYQKSYVEKTSIQIFR